MLTLSMEERDESVEFIMNTLYKDVDLPLGVHQEILADVCALVGTWAEIPEVIHWRVRGQIKRIPLRISQ